MVPSGYHLDNVPTTVKTMCHTVPPSKLVSLGGGQECGGGTTRGWIRGFGGKFSTLPPSCYLSSNIYYIRTIWSVQGSADFSKGGFTRGLVRMGDFSNPWWTWRYLQIPSRARESTWPLSTWTSTRILTRPTSGLSGSLWPRPCAASCCSGSTAGHLRRSLGIGRGCSK